MNVRRLFSIAAVCGAVLSCADTTAPNRTNLYEWRLVVQTDTLSFHWPTSSLPVRIWVEDSLDMPTHIRDGITAWRSAFLYGEYDAIVVSDSSAADVLVRVASAPPLSPASAGRLLTMFPGCQGATDIDTAATRFQLQLPVRMYLTPKYDPALVDLTECFRITATHELGHSLGLFRHTSDTLDIMYVLPKAQVLSARDINTAQVLSHWPANMTPTR